MSARYDALIIGGGPAGSTAAILLARAGWRVAIVEHARFPRRKVCGEYVSAATWGLLSSLGVAHRLAPIAGRPVTHVGLYAGRSSLAARMAGREPGRAVERADLDRALLEAAANAGADVRQPWSFIGSAFDSTDCRSTIECRDTGRVETLESDVIVDAHGAWESIALPGATPQSHREHRRGDLLGFKAHFDGARLPPGLMPLLAFPGGYGGMVETGRRRTSLSLCVRRDVLAQCRLLYPAPTAGDAVLAHIRRSCAGVDAVLSQATMSDRWIAAGPLATGIRSFGSGRVFVVGNAAAEAHPVIAEGISMAIQSSALLARALVERDHDASDFESTRRRYESAWRSHFALRVHAAASFAHLFMRPLPTAIAAHVVAVVPRLLTLGASFSGKASPPPARALR